MTVPFGTGCDVVRSDAEMLNVSHGHTSASGQVCEHFNTAVTWTGRFDCFSIVSKVNDSTEGLEIAVSIEELTY